MKLRELKQFTYNSWEFLHWLEGAVVQPETFKSEVCRYGDLRRKATWEKAFAAFEAAAIEYPALENGQAIQLCFCHPQEPEIIEYNDLILLEFLKFPDAIDRIENGLERLYYQPIAPIDRQDALDFLKRLAQWEELGDRFSVSNWVAIENELSVKSRNCEHSLTIPG
jgi:hypothetical protein